MEAFVVDVSACMAWCCEDETTAASEEMLDWAAAGSVLHVPSVWPWEIVNAVVVAVRRQRIPAVRANAFLEELRAFNFQIDPPPQIADLPRLHLLALTHQLTSYDAAYLDLAKRLGVPLATRDADLKRAAQVERIELI